MKELNYDCDSDVYYGAVLNGNLEMIQWLFEIKCPVPNDILSAAFEYGDLNIIKLFYKCETVYKRQLLFMSAAKNGNLNNMKWLYEQGCPFDDLTFPMTAANGYLDNMKWLYSVGCPLNEETFNAAAINGDIENLKWLRAIGCPWSDKIFSLAIQPKAAEWLIENLYSSHAKVLSWL